jgi:hypothetical protein
VTKNYYWPGVQEPSSAEEIGINMARWNALPDDLKPRRALRLPVVAEEITTEYDANHPRALAELVSRHGVTVREVPRDVLIALRQLRRRDPGRVPRPPGPDGQAHRRQLREFRNRSQAYMLQSYAAPTSTRARCRSAGAETLRAAAAHRRCA